MGKMNEKSLLKNAHKNLYTFFYLFTFQKAKTYLIC